MKAGGGEQVGTNAVAGREAAPQAGAARHWLVIAAAFCAWTCYNVAPLRAQVVITNAQDANPVQPPPPANDDDAIEADVPPAPAQVMVMGVEQFDMWVFGGSLNGASGRAKLDGLLDLTVEDVARACELTESQQRKLKLAGRGDLKRFFDQVDEKRKKFEKLKSDQTKVGELYQETVPLQTQLHAGLFGEGSIYSKTLKRMVGGEQERRYEELIAARKRFAYSAKVELVVAQLDQTLGFSDRQRRGLVDLILKETRPPKHYGQYAFYIVLYQAGRIPRARLKPLFEPRQWDFLVRQLDQMRGMEQFLRSQGLLPSKDEEPEIAHGFIEALRPPAPAADELPGEVFAEGPDTSSAVNPAAAATSAAPKERSRP